jgi:hypothetical protein
LVVHVREELRSHDSLFLRSLGRFSDILSH